MRKTCRKSLAALLSLVLLLTVFSVGVVPLTASAANYTILDASGTNWDSSEGAKKLIDGTVDTKWCSGLINGSLYIVFDVGSSRIARTYTMYTGNDTASYSDRNPRDWKLYGTNSPDHSTGSGFWTEIDTVANDTTLGAANKTGYSFTIDSMAAYRYYKLVITATKGGIFQLSEFTMNFSSNECAWVAGADGNSFGSEKSANLFDGNTGTKWCANSASDTLFVTCDMGRRVMIDGYTVTTANDNASNPGRNPKSWDVLGSNDNANWELVDRIVNDTRLQNVNYTPYGYSISHLKQPYRYYKFLLTARTDAGTMQMSELKYNIVSPSSVSGTASESYYAAQNAFLGDVSLRYESAAENAVLTWDMGKSVVSTGYTLTSCGDAAKNPTAWTLSGSADGSAWTQIDAVTDAALPAETGAATVYSFDFLPEAYRYYKLDMTASSAAAVAVSGVALQYAAHAFTQFECNHNATHQKICTECGLSVTEDCSGLTTTNGVCSVCGGSSAYAVELDAPDATVAGTASVSAVYTQNMPAVTPPQRDGYDFDGFFDAETDGKQYYTADGVSAAAWDVLADSTLHAQWTARSDTRYLIRDIVMNSEGSYDGVEAAERVRFGVTDTTVNVADAALDIAHYTTDAARSDASINIAGDGSAVMNIYYKLDEYTVAFNVNGTETSADYYYGAVPAYDGETPTLAATDEFTYTFLGWTEGAAAEPGSGAAYYAAGSLPPVTADAVYYPYFGAEVNSYNVTFLVDGVQTVQSFPYGATPVYSGVPSKDADAQYTYTFAGWDPAIVPVAGEAVYTAQFDRTPVKYLISAAAGRGASVYPGSQIWEFGGNVQLLVTVEEGYDPDTLTVLANGSPLPLSSQIETGYVYTVHVDGDVTVTIPDLEKYTYTVTFNVDGVETETTVAYGDTPAYSGVPSKAADDENYYVFTGWEPAVVPATADAAYTAQFDTVPFPAHEHDFATFVRTAAATCVSGGYDEYICECGMTEQRNATAVNAANHALSAITVGAREATETEDGYTGDLICPACGATITRGSVLPKTGGDTPAPHEHEFAFVRTVAATCAEKGYDEYACACGMIERRNETATVDADNHTGAMLTVGAREATETADGYTGDTVCSACGKTLAAGSVIPKTGSGETPAVHTHTFDTFVSHHDATCCEKGCDEYRCECGMTEKRNETATVDANNHAGAIITVGKRAATETADGYTGDRVCSACGKTVSTGSVIPKTGTEPTEPTEPEEPTVYETGCPICGQNHDGNFFERLLGLIHTFLHMVRTLFRVVPKN